MEQKCPCPNVMNLVKNEIFIKMNKYIKVDFDEIAVDFMVKYKKCMEKRDDGSSVYSDVTYWFLEIGDCTISGDSDRWFDSVGDALCDYETIEKMTEAMYLDKLTSKKEDEQKAIAFTEMMRQKNLEVNDYDDSDSDID